VQRSKHLGAAGLRGFSSSCRKIAESELLAGPVLEKVWQMSVVKKTTKNKIQHRANLKSPWRFPIASGIFSF